MKKHISLIAILVSLIVIVAILPDTKRVDVQGWGFSFKTA